MVNTFLTPDQLVDYVKGIVKRPKLWKHLVEHGEGRSYQLLADTEVLNCWVISWNVGHDTGLHDHDGSAGGVVVVEGIVHESRLIDDTIDCEGIPTNGLFEAGLKYEKGGTFSFGPSAIHRVRHHGKKPAVTIHAYSPPLKRMGSYSTNDADEFTRLPMTEKEELKPLELAVKDVHQKD